MKIAVSAMGKELSDNISDVFGRCPFFVVVDVEDGEMKKVEAFKNESAKQVGGAGIAASKFLAQKDITVVIAKNVGPRAMDVLKQFEIEVYNYDGVVKNAIQKVIDDKIK